jgi:hypothetical protein
MDITEKDEIVGAIRAIRREINTIHKIIKLIAEDESDVFYPAGMGSAYYADMESLGFSVDYWTYVYCMDLTTDFSEMERWQFDLILDLINNNLPYKTFTYDEYLEEYGDNIIGLEGIPGFIIGVTEYDKRNDTHFALLIIRCFEALGKSLQQFCKKESGTFNSNTANLLAGMRGYVYTEIIDEEDLDSVGKLIEKEEVDEFSQEDEYDFNDEETNYHNFLKLMQREQDKEIKEAFVILNEMMNTFENWFPKKEFDSEEDLEMAKNRFATAKLSLELGEYSNEDDDYLCYIQEQVAENPRYDKAMGTFIKALVKEYGWL